MRQHVVLDWANARGNDARRRRARVTSKASVPHSSHAANFELRTLAVQHETDIAQAHFTAIGHDYRTLNRVIIDVAAVSRIEISEQKRTVAPCQPRVGA